MSIAVVLASSIYPEQCFHEAAKAFITFGRITIADQASGNYQIKIDASSGVDERTLFREFLNYLLTLSIERNLEKD